MNRILVRVLLPAWSLLAFSCSYSFYPAPAGYPVYSHVQKIAAISDTLRETSGLVRTDQEFLTFNDSGGDPALYGFTGKEAVPVRYAVSAAGNRDWEDVAFGRDTFYIADAGNNFGARAKKFPLFFGTQMEGICYDDSGNVFLTSEKRLYKQALFRAY